MRLGPRQPPAGAAGLSRRSVLGMGLSASTLLATSCTLGSVARAAAQSGDPFTLGVASGEPSPDGVVLWTRIATNPLADDGLGGLGTATTDVEWELAADAGFRRIERRGMVTTGPELGHSVHVELAGLPADRDWFYRFRARGHLSPAGRTRTTPPLGVERPFTACVASCAQYEHGLYTAYARMAEEEPDLVLHLGDYIYESAAGRYVAAGGNVRAHVGPEPTTLADYRLRHAQYKTDPDLQAAHAAAPWLVVFDDHEVENNWAGDVRALPLDPPGDFLLRRAAAFRAYWENMPLRAAQRPNGSHMQLYRRVGWGGLATFHMLDTRQYRDDQACDDKLGTDCAERTDPARSLPGSAQERWIADGFRDSRARWDVLGQQVFFAQLDLVPGVRRGFSPDAWDGYPASRDRVVDAWVAARGRNLVVLTGDVHAHWATDIRQRFDDPGSPTIGAELVTSSITSTGDGTDADPLTPAFRADNPHIHFFSDRRGYVRARFEQAAVRADFQVVAFVRRPGALVQTRASFVVEDRRAGLQPV